MTDDRKFLRLGVIAPVLIILFAIFLLPGASLYYSYSGGKSCTKCHEIWQPYRDWHESAHRNIACSECHGDVLTLDAGFHLKNIRQLAAHLRGKIPEEVRLKRDDVLEIEKRCAKCHREEYASWSAGPHSVTYAKIFLSKDHNQQTLLMDDCLRCHSMQLPGQHPRSGHAGEQTGTVAPARFQTRRSVRDPMSYMPPTAPARRSIDPSAGEAGRCRPARGDSSAFTRAVRPPGTRIRLPRPSPAARDV
jgi:hypothetical protein